MKITSREIIEILKTARELGYREFHLEHDGLVLRASSTARALKAGTSAEANDSNVALTDTQALRSLAPQDDGAGVALRQPGETSEA